MAVTAQGTTLKFTPQGGEQVTVGKVVSIGEIGGDSQEIDVTTLDSQGGYREYAQGYKDAGSLAVQGYHDKSDAGQAALQGRLLLPGLGQCAGDAAHLGVHAGGGDHGGPTAVGHHAAHVDHVFPVT